MQEIHKFRSDAWVDLKQEIRRENINFLVIWTCGIFISSAERFKFISYQLAGGVYFTFVIDFHLDERPSALKKRDSAFQ